MRDNLVFIPSLGIITEATNLIMPITLAYSARNVFRIARDSADIYSSRDILVERSVEIDTKAIIMIDHNAGIIQSTAEGLVDHYSMVERAIEAGRNGEVEEPVKKKKKGKKNREESEATESLPDITALTSPMVHEIVVTRTSIEQEPTPIQNTKPYQALAVKHEDKLRGNLGRLTRSISGRADVLQHLRTPNQDTVEESLDDLLPRIDDTTVDTINRAGLSNYEDKLRREVAEFETQIHNLYDWFEERVIARYNSKAQVMSGVFTEKEKVIADVTLNRAELLETLFKDEIIFLSPKVYVPSSTSKKS